MSLRCPQPEDGPCKAVVSGGLSLSTEVAMVGGRAQAGGTQR